MLGSESFSSRCQSYLLEASKSAHNWFDGKGRWIARERPLLARERFWLCCALYSGGEAEFADSILREADIHLHGEDVTFDIFHTNIAAVLLTRRRRHMAGDVIERLEGLVRDGFSFRPGNRAPEFQFHGYNDNMPAEAAMGLILGGEMLGDEEAVDHGLARLRQFRRQLARRGVNSEFNSPTYTPVTVHALGEVASHARNPEAREIALGLEERLWIDLSARFHTQTGVMAGPYSRAYTADAVAGVTCAASLLWFVLGDAARPSPMELFSDDEQLVIHHGGDRPFNIAQMCWFADGSYHVPDAAIKLFLSDDESIRAVAMAEVGDFGLDFPATPVRVETLRRPDYAVGSCSAPFAGGEQTLSYFVTYRRRAPVVSRRDVGVIFHKYVVDDDGPGVIEESGGYRGEPDLLFSHCNSLTIQSGSTVALAAHPHLSLGGPADVDPAAGVPEPKRLSRLSELVIFPSRYGGFDELMVGSEPRSEWSGEAPHGAWIACRRGRLLCAFRPLAYSETFGLARVTLENFRGYEVIRTTAYRGEPRAFTRRELRRIMGGMIAEHASVDDFPSLAAFAQSLSAATILDYAYSTRRLRYRRPACAHREALEIDLSWSAGSRAPRHAAIDGKPVDEPIVRIDGLDSAALPFLNGVPSPEPPEFPWRRETDPACGSAWIVGDIDC